MSKFTKLDTITKTPSGETFDLVDQIPNLPEELVDKFPEVSDFNRQMNEFWFNVKASLGRRERRISDLEAQVIATEARIDALHP